jgi:hypothetical protein
MYVYFQIPKNVSLNYQRSEINSERERERGGTKKGTLEREKGVKRKPWRLPPAREQDTEHPSNDTLVRLTA